MAQEDKYAFDAMNASDPDMDVTGGAIEYSSYEMDMSPSEQKSYEENLKSALSISYRSDPYKGKLGFQDWFKELRPDLVMERARKWEELREDKKMDTVDSKEERILEASGILQRLLNKHTGRLADVQGMVKGYDPESRESKISKAEYRR